MSDKWDHEVNDVEQALGLEACDLEESRAIDPSISQSINSKVNASMGSSLSSTLENGPVDGSSRWELEPNEIEVGRELGGGVFGVVYKGKLRGKGVAIKKLKKQDFDDSALEDFKKEVEILNKLRHPNVVLFMGACFKPGDFMIVTELTTRGSLRDLLNDEKVTLSFKRKIKMAKDAALGCNYLHCSKPPIVHRDLKTSNILVDANYTVKVADFGLSTVKGNKTDLARAGTPLWMAPEVLSGTGYDESCDLYSFGIVLWELITAKVPFDDVKDLDGMITAVVKNKKRPEIPKDAPSRLRKLIQACWAQDPKKRPKFSQIIPQFDQIIVDAIIHDDHGRKMWKKYFLKDKLRESISWRNFVIAFTSYFKQKVPNNQNDTRWKCLKTLLTNQQDKVSMEKFSSILDWFGPMTGVDSLLLDVEELLKEKWFHGEISSQTAEQRLSGQDKGTFLMRFSARDPGCYAISVVSQQGKLKHYRIYHKPGLDYLIGKTECSGLIEIVKKYHKELHLITPCPGSPFVEIFSSGGSACVGYLVPKLQDQ